MNTALIEKKIAAKIEETKSTALKELRGEIELYQELDDGEKFNCEGEFGVCHMMNKEGYAEYVFPLTLLSHTEDNILVIQIEPVAYYVVEVLSWNGVTKQIEEEGYIDPNYEALDVCAKEGQGFRITVTI